MTDIRSTVSGADLRFLQMDIADSDSVEAAAAMIGSIAYGDPEDGGNMTGAIVNRAQLERMDGLVQRAIADGARVVVGGGIATQFDKGFFFQPTLLADVTNDMTVAREEIFGPVITILGARDEADAVKIANDTPYGLAGYVSAGSVESANRVGRQIRAGNVNLNGVPNERTAPFGGYKQSGNGREWGKFGMEEFLEVKAIAGANPS